MISKTVFLVFFCQWVLLSHFAQGPFAPPAGEVGTTALHKDSSVFIAWATLCEVTRGYQDIAQPSLGKTSTGFPANGAGPVSSAPIVSLGDSGVAILTFALPIANGDGWDFAVFENAFQNTFLELAFVEVSSDGVHYFRFPATSLTPTDVQIDNFGAVDATNINNLAGKYRVNYGTPFDLEELVGEVGLDVMAVTHIKIIDVVGSIDPLYASYDALGNVINDPYPTAFPQGGFDLDGVGVIHQKPVAVAELFANQISVYPNPTNDILWIKNSGKSDFSFQLTNLSGQVVFEQTTGAITSLSVAHLPDGIYFLTCFNGEETVTLKIVHTN